MLIDDFGAPGGISKLGTSWRGVSDQVMGGLSKVIIGYAKVSGRRSMHLTGDVRMENNGGFIQASLDLAAPNETFDATAYAGLRLVVRGNGERYGLHLRTADTRRPWQSYRASFDAGPAWLTIDRPFECFAPHRIEAPLDTSRLRRLGLVAIGRAFSADLAVCELRLYAKGA